MIRSSLVKIACLGIALSGFSPPPAGAIEMSQGSNPAARLYDDMITKVVIYRGATYRGPRGGVYHRGGVYRGVPYRGVYRGGVYRYGGWARPGWYHWGPGGAIAAGAAIGVLAAGAAVAYAGRAPGPGLCWYYTDPTYRAGFWDAC
jgi:hypothetical protein